MRPVDGRAVYLVYTRWRSEDDFQAWVNSPAFQHGHKSHNASGPVGTSSELWSFDVIQHEE
jgi:heme oxygenase (mycobilin-producing)